jgi:fibronectin-binding autotransporter adhesin
MKTSLLPILSSLALLPASAQAANYTFNGTVATSLWGTTTTWSPNGTPGSGDAVSLVNTSSSNLGVNGNRSVASMSDAGTTASFSVLANSGGNATLTIGSLVKTSNQNLNLRSGGSTTVLSLNITSIDQSGSTGTLNIGNSGTQIIGSVAIGSLTMNTTTNGMIFTGADGGVASIGSANMTQGNIAIRNIDGGSYTLEIGSLSGSGGSIKAINSARSQSTIGNLKLTNASGEFSYAGTLVNGAANGTLTVEKNGAGTQVLSGSNTYTGSTTISAGTLLTTKAASLAGYNTSNKVVFNGGTVGVQVGDSGWTTAQVDTLLGNATKTTGALGIDTTNGNLTQWTAFTTTNLGPNLGLAKLGNNTLTLNETNTYTGATVVTAGTLQIGAGGTTGSIASSSSITNNAALLINRSNDMTLSNSLSGSGNLTKAGSGTLTLSGSNINSGAVSVTGGTLLLGGGSALSSNASLLSAASGTTISLADGAGRTITLATGNLSLDSATMVFELGSTTDRLTLTSGMATLSGTNTIRLADIGSFAAGTYTLISAASGLNGSWSLDSLSGPTGFTYTLSNSSTTLSLIAAASSNSFYWTGNASANWSGNNFSATDGGASTLSGGDLSAASDILFASAGATNLATTMSSNYTVNSLAISTPGVSIGGTNTLTVNSTASTAIAVSATSGNTTISANLAGASAGLTKSGAGTLILSGSNSYTGPTTVTAGTLQIGAGGTTGSLSASSTLTNNGTLVFNRSNAITQGMDFAAVIAGSGNVIKTGTGNLTLSGNNTFTGQLTIAEGVVVVTSVNNSGVIGVFGNSTNSVVLGSNGKNGTVSFGGSNVSSNKAFTISSGGTGVFDVTANQLTVGAIDGSGALSKTGGGTLVLSSTNTYSGGSSLLLGTVAIGNDSALGSGAVNLAGGQLRATSGASRTIGNTILISADTTFGTLASEKSLTFTGNTTLSGGTRTLNVQLGSTVNTEKLTFSGAIGDGGNGFGITKTGNGTLNISGSNTYTGTTTVSAGTLEIGNINALQNSTLNTGSSGAQTVNFTLSGANTYNLGGLQGSDALAIGNNTLSIGANNASTTYSGAISGTGGNLTKVGSGTLTLNGANTYIGNTTVSSGTLTANATGALGGTTKIDLNGGSLLVAADNAVNDNANINLNGGTLAVNGTFDETIGALTLSANSTIDFAGFVGTLRFGSIASWATDAKLAVWNWSGTTEWGTQVNNYNNPSRLVFTNSNAALTNNLDNISFYSDSGNSFVGNGFVNSEFTGSGTEIIAVPEPGTYLCGIGLLIGLIVQSMRKSRNKIS